MQNRYSDVQYRSRQSNSSVVVMENRFTEDRRLGLIIACVGRLIESIATRDRWQIARNTTGPLLEKLLAGQFDYRLFMGEGHSQPGLEGVPVAVADSRVALVVGAVKTGSSLTSNPVTVVLVAAPEHPRRWLVAALDIDMVVSSQSLSPTHSAEEIRIRRRGVRVDGHDRPAPGPSPSQWLVDRVWEPS